MTISAGPLLAVVVAVVAVASGIFLWQSREPAATPESFHADASAICRESLPAIATAPSFDAALAESQSMRAQLSKLTPPTHLRPSFDAWIASLQGSETALVRGDVREARFYDAQIGSIVTVLGLADACTLRS